MARKIAVPKVKVSNLWGRNNNKIPNQFEIRTDKGVYFQSYDSIIAVKLRKDGRTYLDEGTWDYSPTTGKYRNQFLGENKAETLKKIDSGEYKLVDLNR